MKTKLTLLLTMLMAGQSAIAAPKPLTEADRKKSAQIIDDAILKAARKSVKALHLAGKGISDVSSLEGLTNLEHLELYSNQITDLKPLAGLKSLKLLWLTENPNIKDYSPIAGVRGQLENYSSGGNGITNLEVLGISQMTSLETLWLHNNQITDLTPLVGLKKLETLYLYSNRIKDLTGLSGLRELKGLHLHNNQITDLTPLAKLAKLQWIDLRANPNLAKAEVVKLQKALPYCSIIEDLLSGSERIEVHIHKQAKKPEGELTKSDLERVEKISLPSSGITEISTLARLTKLKDLHLGNNQITDLTPLAELEKLGILILHDNKITDLTALARLTKLETLYLHNNRIKDLTGLSGLRELKGLHLYNNQITDLTPLAKLAKLQWIDLRANPNLTKAEIIKLQNALPKCKISHDAKK